MPRPLPLTAVLLAGGASRRMGRDKALLAVRGLPMAHLLARHLASRCRKVLVARGGRALHGLGVGQLADPEGAEGPLAGLAAGLAASPTPWVLLVACDQPPPPDALLELLWRSRSGASSALLEAGKPLPFPALYHRTILPRLRLLLKAGAGPSALLRAIPGERIPERVWRRADPEERCLVNWNTPAAFRKWAPLTLGSRLPRMRP